MGSWLERREVPITSGLFSISLGSMGKYREEMGTQQGSPDSEPLPLRYVGEHSIKNIFVVTLASPLGFFQRCVLQNCCLTWSLKQLLFPESLG